MKKYVVALWMVIVLLALCACDKKEKTFLMVDEFGVDFTACLDQEMTKILDALDDKDFKVELDGDSSNNTVKTYTGVEKINGIDYKVTLTFIKNDKDFKLAYYDKSHNFAAWPTGKEAAALEEVFELWKEKYGEPTYEDSTSISELDSEINEILVQWKKSTHAVRRAEMHVLEDGSVDVFFYDCSVDAKNAMMSDE